MLVTNLLNHTAWNQATQPWAQLDSQEPAAGFPAQAPATWGYRVFICLPESGTLRLASVGYSEHHSIHMLGTRPQSGGFEW